jgi:hypothetical protein
VGYFLAVPPGRNGPLKKNNSRIILKILLGKGSIDRAVGVFRRKSLPDYANPEIGVPVNRFLPLKMGISGRAGVSPAYEEKPWLERSSAVFR